MPTLRELHKQMKKLDKASGKDGYYAITFKDDWTKWKFIQLERFYGVIERVKKICHL
jgi:hypothetical protein